MTISAKVTGQNVVLPSDTEEDNTEDEASAASTAQPAQESPVVAETPSLDRDGMPAAGKSSNKLAVGTMFGAEALAHLLTFFHRKHKQNVSVQKKEQNIHHSFISHSFRCLWFSTN